MDKKIVFHPYIPAMINHVEKWLTDMSDKGWKLVRKDGWKFYFIKSFKQERRYFMYTGFDASKGFSHEYYRAQKKFAKSGTEINKRTDGVFEVDPCKMDDDFHFYRMIRNKYYRKHYIKLALFSSFFVALSLAISIYNFYFLFVIGIPYLIMFIYAFVSILMICCSEKQQHNHYV